MASLRSHGDSDCKRTPIIRHFHLYIIQFFTHGDVVNAQTWEVSPPKKSSRATLSVSCVFTMAVFILRTHYLSGRTWANILQLVWLRVSIIKTGTRHIYLRIMCPDELPERQFVQTSNAFCSRLYTRRITRRTINVCPSSSRRLMRPSAQYKSGLKMKFIFI